MRKCYNAAIFNQRGHLLILLKNESWILSGGKPKVSEDYKSCIKREISEELSGTEIEIGEFLVNVVGKSPNLNLETSVDVYMGFLKSELKAPSGEIKDYAWMSYEDRDKYNLSDITKNIVKLLRGNVRYTGFN